MQKYFTEALGTFLFVFFSIFAAVEVRGNVFLVAVIIAGSYAVLCILFGNISGAHFNPAVSLGAWIARSLSTHDLVPYFLAQFGGAVAGSVLLRLIVGPHPLFGATIFMQLLSWSALLIEAALTFVLVTAYLLSQNLDYPSQPWFRMGIQGVLVGGILFFAHFVAFSVTGAGLNPARSVAPVVIGANIQAARQLWVYVVGPFLGGVLAGIFVRLSTRTVPHH